MFKKIVIVVLLSIAGVLVFAATRPDTFHVERSVSIAASPEKVLGLVNDFHHWSAWSPWEKLDPAMTRTFGGPTSGVGAVYEWSGNSEVGSGRMEILTVESTGTTIDLQFKSPMESRNKATFATTPAGSATQVKWQMDGPMPFISKVMCLFVSMDSLIGKDFEKGLANLKAVAEK